MKKLVLLALVLEFAVCGCGTQPHNAVTTTTSGNWEAQFLGGEPSAGTGTLFPASQLNFVTAFDVTSVIEGTPRPLNITGFGFFNAGQCFATGIGAETAIGTATLNTAQSGQVNGSFEYTVTSVATPSTVAGNVLSLTTKGGGVSGTSNGTSTTTGTLSNGIFWGQWTLTSSDTNCLPKEDNGSVTGTYIMCQGTATCTPPL
ncbi:MAG TPA: hypothetical protein VJQ59_16375 [Candidatus Sulfotelmatobacter sp.]|nr:hypothetical protein [Candidatus Sulfotelmatobacter sp.]